LSNGRITGAARVCVYLVEANIVTYLVVF